jgi:hypothetical protein
MLVAMRNLFSQGLGSGQVFSAKYKLRTNAYNVTEYDYQIITEVHSIKVFIF